MSTHNGFKIAISQRLFVRKYNNIASYTTLLYL